MDVAQTKMRAGLPGCAAVEKRGTPRPVPDVPWYMKQVYWWAYMRPFSLAIFDHVPIVSFILFGNYGRLKRAALAEIRKGQSVLQAACVYGDLSRVLAERVGPTGALDVIDVVPLQVANNARKLRDYPWSRVRLADAAFLGRGGERYDAVCCFFLLHELPDDYRKASVNALLGSVAPGGRAIFVDYHMPHRLHPLKPLMRLVNRFLEPFANSLWQCEIRDLARDPGAFVWRKKTYFGGLFQKVVAERRAPGGWDSPRPTI